MRRCFFIIQFLEVSYNNIRLELHNNHTLRRSSFLCQTILLPVVKNMIIVLTLSLVQLLLCASLRSGGREKRVVTRCAARYWDHKIAFSRRNRGHVGSGGCAEHSRLIGFGRCWWCGRELIVRAKWESTRSKHPEVAGR